MTRTVYLALGDSVTAGFGATHPGMSFIRHVSEYTRQTLQTEATIVLARNGWTAKDVWQAANTVSDKLWQQTKVFSLMVGGNDLRRLLRRQFLPISEPAITPRLVNQRLEEFGYYMDKLCAAIEHRDVPYVMVATIYNPVPNFPVAVHAMESLNEMIQDIAKHHKFEVVDIYTEFQENENHFIDGYRTGRYEDLAFPFGRPIHPNNAGHRRIADLMSDALANAKKNPTC